MAKKDSGLTATDQFCGAGGSSTGAVNAGVEVKMALNHWKLAIETHNTNHPFTDHDCTDVQACDPRRYPSTNILITSPECTNHSLAKGKKRKFQNQLKMFGKVSITPEQERSRATMFDVCRFAECHDYDIVIVENVVDARYWRMWDAWLMAMHSLGYQHKCLYLNSMHFFPCPQSRDRMYVVFWKKGNPKPDLEFRPKAPCEKCGIQESYQSWKKTDKKWGKFKQQYFFRCSKCTGPVQPFYFAALNCIDFTIEGQRIGDRKKPLAANTIRRIQYGLDKFGNKPMVITTRYSSGLDCRVKDALLDVVPTQPGDQSHGFLCPFFVSSEHSTASDENRTKSGSESLWTQTTTQSTGIVLPHLLVGNYTPGWTRKLDRTTGTITTDDHHGLLSMPCIIENFGNSNAKPASRPIGAMTTNNNYGVLTKEKFQSFLTYYNGNSLGATGMNQPAGTVTTHDRISLVTPKEVNIEDCHYRMLKPHEIQTAMAFAQDYKVLGNSRQKVKQLGNAVTPPVMEWIVKRCVQTLQ